MFLASKSSNQDLPILFIGRAENDRQYDNIDLSLGVLTDGILNTPSAGDFIIGYAPSRDSLSLFTGKIPSGFTVVQMNEIDITSTSAITDGYYYLFYGYYNPSDTIFEVLGSRDSSYSYITLFVYRSVDPNTALDVSLQYTALNTDGTYSSQPSITPSTTGAVILSGAYAYSESLYPTENGLQSEPANNTNYFSTYRTLAIGSDFHGHTFSFAEYRGWVSGTFTPDDFGPAAGDGVQFPEVGTFTVALRPRFVKNT